MNQYFTYFKLVMKNLLHETQVRYEIINVFSYRTKLFTKVSNLPIHILCTSGRNVQDALGLNSLSKTGMTTVEILCNYYGR